MSKPNVNSGQHSKNNLLDEFPGILITGGAGFIGSHLVDSLLSWFPSTPVTVADAFTYAANSGNLTSAAMSGRLQLVRASVEDGETLRSLIRPGMLVLHLAAESHVPRSFSDPGLFDRVNHHGTRVLLEAARASGAKRVIHFSTDEVYGSRLSPAEETSAFAPTSPYARSKAAAEGEVEIARDRGLDVTILRPSNVIGPRQHCEKLVPRFIGMAQAGKPFQLEGDGLQKRTFLAICDLINSVRLILEKGTSNATYNVAGAETLSVIEVARIVADMLERPCRFVHVRDRPTNDRAYMLDGGRLAALGFQSRLGVKETVRGIIDEDMRQPSEAPAPAPVTSICNATTAVA
ncbi:GDP-mannose 4,6-dehydratase [Nitratireductor aquimarinus]|uniref:NAD-dependent epimerase/dehydratase family protein n=1 Tax=Nitratireductor aquimarinus TaxID=889300 RepID=UPI002935B9AE|nr:NAD-dependent epimerase/dehydratase family protein [Nitratireductor aquimarinus]MDV2967666.1 GDP-mannose 4,6-dehydratase [Nitratireductor aquimarinus]